MNETTALAENVTATPVTFDPLDYLDDWERAALVKLRLLRASRKRAMLYVTEMGIILVFIAEPAGRIGA